MPSFPWPRNVGVCAFSCLSEEGRAARNMESVRHAGIRIRDRARVMGFYHSLGFQVVSSAVFDNGHPAITKHPKGVAANLLGAAHTSERKSNRQGVRRTIRAIRTSR